MVFEEEPSPESVGREFVRQYYTVLNACPENLHRFYNSESSFVHGGLDQPGESTKCAKGQAEIHKRIMSLNLRECRAKIRQVDSFETVNGALVIQVIGELGNNGESMRRFVQTFVLVQQSPKSYYVNNDIFRYQDDAFREAVTENAPTKSHVKTRGEQRVDNSVSVNASERHASNVESFTNGSWAETEHAKEETSHATQFTAQGQQATKSEQPANFEQPPQQPVQQQQPPKTRHRNDRERAAPQRTETTNQEPADTNANATNNHKETNAETEETQGSTGSAPSKPLTFAAVAGGGSGSNVPPAPAKQQAPTKTQVKPVNREKSPVAVSRTEDQENSQPDQGNQPNAGGRPSFRPNYSNEQQVFVGNLPQDVSDEELQDFMSKFGGVVEVKICNKQVGRQPQGRVTPAFAFVTFEHVEAVDKMMGTLPITDFRGQLRLNIERKQERERNFYGGGQGGNFRGGQQSAGGPGGQRGGMRGGGSGRRFTGPPRGGGAAFVENRQ